MTFSARQRIFMETNLARDRAETLLAELLDASRAVQIHNVVHNAHPPFDCIDSLDRAISSTRRMINALNGALDQSQSDLADEDLALLDRIVAGPDAAGAGRRFFDDHDPSAGDGAAGDQDAVHFDDRDDADMDLIDDRFDDPLDRPAVRIEEGDALDRALTEAIEQLSRLESRDRAPDPSTTTPAADVGPSNGTSNGSNGSDGLNRSSASNASSPSNMSGASNAPSAPYAPRRNASRSSSSD